MIHNIQNIEVFSTDTSNYLLIHKNACTQILYTLENNYKKVVYSPELLPNNKPYWTVIRDPYERFISGLTYDIVKVYGSTENANEIIKNRDLKNLFFNKVNRTYRKNGFTVHTLPQWTYIFNQPINFFVPMSTLTLFLDTHFKNKVLNKNKGNEKDIEIIRDIIESDSVLKGSIDMYLASDYFLYNHIISEGLIWEWNYGKMF